MCSEDTSFQTSAQAGLHLTTRTAGVAMSPQRPAAVILTASPKTRFYFYMRGVVAT